MKINYTTPDGSRTQATIDDELIQLWATATGEQAEARTVAEEVVPRALKRKHSGLTQTRRIERQLIEDTQEALRMEWQIRDPYRRWCYHYGYNPDSAQAEADYAEYQKQQNLFNDLV